MIVRMVLCSKELLIVHVHLEEYGQELLQSVSMLIVVIYLYQVINFSELFFFLEQEKVIFIFPAESRIYAVDSCYFTEFSVKL